MEPANFRKLSVCDHLGVWGDITHRKRNQAATATTKTRTTSKPNLPKCRTQLPRGVGTTSPPCAGGIALAIAAINSSSMCAVEAKFGSFFARIAARAAKKEASGHKVPPIAPFPSDSNIVKDVGLHNI